MVGTRKSACRASWGPDVDFPASLRDPRSGDAPSRGLARLRAARRQRGTGRDDGSRGPARPGRAVWAADQARGARRPGPGGAPPARPGEVRGLTAAGRGRGQRVNSARTPSSRTGRPGLNWPSAARAARSIATASDVAAGSGWPWVWVMNGAYLTLTTTRRAG